MVDALIQTFNEEKNLPHTLSSVAGWATRIFVIDSGSTDRTVEIARQHGATVVHHAWEGYARQKNWALDNLELASEWTLIIDADEAVSPELRDEILSLVKKPADSVPECGFLINRVFIFMGRKIWHSGYFPSWNLRLFKRGRARYEDRSVHEHMICDGPVGRMKHLLIHEDRRGLEHFFAKHNRYSSLEAQELFEHPEPWPGFVEWMKNPIKRRRFLKSRILPKAPMAWMWRFFYMYVLRLGFLDGRAGWWLAQFISNYEFAVQMKLRQLRKIGRDGITSANALAAEEGAFDADIAGHWPRRGPAGGAAASAGAASAASQSQFQSPGSPTLVERRAGALFPKAEGDRLVFVSPWTFRQNVVRALWMVTSKVLFRPSFHNWYGWRRLLLRMFGATIGRDVRIRPTVHIEIPWNLDIHEGAVVGDWAILYSLGPITIGRRAVVSQYAHLCAGTHDYHYRDFPLLRPPIVIGDGAWIAADAFVGPNVTVGEGAVIGARSSVFKDIPPNVVAVGNPAVPVKRRRFYDDEPPAQQQTDSAVAGAAPPIAMPELEHEQRIDEHVAAGNGEAGDLAGGRTSSHRAFEPAQEEARS